MQTRQTDDQPTNWPTQQPSNHPPNGSRCLRLKNILQSSAAWDPFQLHQFNLMFQGGLLNSLILNFPISEWIIFEELGNLCKILDTVPDIE